MLVSHPAMVPTSWFVFLFAVHILLPSAYLKEFGDLQQGHEEGTESEPLLG